LAKRIKEGKYIRGRAELLVTMCEVTLFLHLAVAMLLEVPASGSFILKVYISNIRRVICIL
jgi:hypothetical protein